MFVREPGSFLACGATLCCPETSQPPCVFSSLQTLCLEYSLVLCIGDTRIYRASTRCGSTTGHAATEATSCRRGHRNCIAHVVSLAAQGFLFSKTESSADAWPERSRWQGYRRPAIAR